MAISEELGLSVAVHVDGTALVEYDDPEVTPDTRYPDSPIVTKYIESKDDVEFSIACTALPGLTWLAEPHTDSRIITISAYTDGNHRCTALLEPKDLLRRTTAHLKGEKYRPAGASHESLRKFRFDAVTTLDTVESKVTKAEKQAAADLGIIRVEVWHTLRRGLMQPPGQEQKQAKFTIAEKALKGRAVSHATRLSAPTQIPLGSWIATEKVSKQPYAIFVFKPRSREALRNEMIVPRTPSPVLAPEALAGLSQEEIHRLAEERLAELKKEKKPVIKREFGELYDLTGEDVYGSLRPTKMLRRQTMPDTVD